MGKKRAQRTRIGTGTVALFIMMVPKRGKAREQQTEENDRTAATKERT